MSRRTIKERYIEVINKSKIPDNDKEVVSYIFAYRQKNGRSIPEWIYKKYYNDIYFKPSLGKPSRYYVDLLKMEDEDKLIKLIEDIYTNSISEGTITDFRERMEYC